MLLNKKEKTVVESIEIELSREDKIALRRVATILDEVLREHWDTEVSIYETVEKICKYGDNGAYVPDFNDMDMQDCAYLLRKFSEYKD